MFRNRWIADKAAVPVLRPPSWAAGLTLVEVHILLALVALVAVGVGWFTDAQMEMIAESEVRERVPRLLDWGEELSYFESLDDRAVPPRALAPPLPPICSQEQLKSFATGLQAHADVEELVVHADDPRAALLDNPFSEGGDLGSFVLSFIDYTQGLRGTAVPAACRGAPDRGSRVLFLCLPVGQEDQVRLSEALGALAPSGARGCPMQGSNLREHRGDDGDARWLVWVRHLPLQPRPLLEDPSLLLLGQERLDSGPRVP